MISRRHAATPRVRSLIKLLAACCLLAPLVAVPASASAGTVLTVSDNFNRANGSLGTNWTDTSDGGLAIASDQVVGTNGGGNSGDMYTGQTFTSDQFSQVTLTSTQLTGTEWIGPVVRAQASGQDAYVGFYFWNNGSPELMLFLRDGGGWTNLGSYSTAALPAGTVIELEAVGGALTLLENGVAVIQASDTTLTGGAPGIMANSLAVAGAWSGGNVAGTTYTIGGTASGLTGPVVLKDNGGDSLSVSGNGAFTFATPLADGATYNVTLTSPPSGETCTVSNGSGTVVSAAVTSVSVLCAATGGSGSGSGSSVSDNFSRANGSLGANWTNTSDGGLKISSDVVVGTVSGGNSGDMYTGQSFTSDQFSQIALTSTQLTGSQWIGPMVRAQASGQSGYVGFYFWNSGSPELMVYLRSNGGWTNLGSYNSGKLPAGTLLELKAQGNSVTLLENGAAVIQVSNSSLTGGAPGILANGLAKAGVWSGGSIAGATYTVGGTVSGLTGTAVLQDNGGDALSVSTNGSFTFATPLSGGAAYNVTVQSAPTGQTCTASGGAGTVAAANVTSVLVSCAATGGSGSGGGSGSSASDNFSRANGGLGANWTNISDGGLAISSDQVVGTSASGDTGDMYTAQAFNSDQFSQIALTSTQLTGTQWIGPAVRAQANGQSAYVGLYFWNNGSPELMLFLRSNGGWTQLATVNTAALAAGTQLEVEAAGSSLSLLENGVQVLEVSNTALTGGAPGIMANELGRAGAWTGGNVAAASFSVGGVASGLTGPVVLQDNGADNLTVAGNGSFTFGTLLTNGGSYNVTVKSYPTGETCTVSQGSGTVGAGNVTSVAVWCGAIAGSGTSASDNFGRANGSLGPNWTDMTGGGLAISSGAVVGTSASGNTGDTYTAQTFASDQFSQVTLTGTQLTGTQWIGPAVRSQAGGQDLYVGFYYWNSGNPELMLFLRNSGTWVQLAGATTAALPAGTVLQLDAIGNSLSFLENGVQVLGVSDTTLTGGAPAIIANGAASAGNWSGGNAGFQVHYQSTASGIASYNFLSANDGYGPQTLRVLQPTNPAAGVAHNFLIVLPVEPGLGNNFGDGLATLQAMDAQDKYNLTIVEPTFYLDPWYANNATDPNLQYETFLTQELVPWLKQNLATSGSEQVWLIGFSKSGLGAQDLILKHPDVFTLAASWDFPADISSYNQYSDSAASYGTDANFQANYRLTAAFVAAHEAPFQTSNRIWTGGWSLYPQDVSDYDALLAAAGIEHTDGPSVDVAHRWDSGWVPAAVAALYQDSLNSPG